MLTNGHIWVTLTILSLVNVIVANLVKDSWFVMIKGVLVASVLIEGTFKCTVLSVDVELSGTRMTFGLRLKKMKQGWAWDELQSSVLAKPPLLVCGHGVTVECRYNAVQYNAIFHAALSWLKQNIWVRSRNCGCLVTWFCYQLIAKPGNKTAAVSWPDPYISVKSQITPHISPWWASFGVYFVRIWKKGITL